MESYPYRDCMTMFLVLSLKCRFAQLSVTRLAIWKLLCLSCTIKRLEFFGALLTVSPWPQHSQKSLLPRGRWERFLYWQGKQQGHSLHQLAVVVKQRVICNCSWKTTSHHLVYLPSNGLQHSGQPWRTVKRHPVVPIHHQCNTGLLCWRAVLWNTIEVGFNPS